MSAYYQSEIDVTSSGVTAPFMSVSPFRCFPVAERVSVS